MTFRELIRLISHTLSSSSPHEPYEKFLEAHMSVLFSHPDEHKQIVSAIELMMVSSGDTFFNDMQDRATIFIDEVTDADLSSAQFQEEENVLTLDNVILVITFYAGRIKQQKRKRDTDDTEHDQVTKLLIKKESRIILDTIIINYALQAAMEFCEKHDDPKEGDDDYDPRYDPDFSWEDRANAIEASIASWDRIYASAINKDWEQFIIDLQDVEEIDAR